jgi:hypothetical protein
VGSKKSNGQRETGNRQPEAETDPPHSGALISVVVETEKRLKSAYVNVRRAARRTVGGAFFSRTLSKNETMMRFGVHSPNALGSYSPS